MASEDTVVRAWTNLHFAYREMRKLVDERLRAGSECTFSDFEVLNELVCTADRRLQMLDLADRLGVTRGGLTRIVDRLVERGWVSRDRPDTNRREVFAVLTGEGDRVVGDARAVYVRVLTETFGARLDDPTLDALATSAGVLRSAIGDTALAAGRP